MALLEGTVTPYGINQRYIEWDNPTDSRDTISPDPARFSWKGTTYEITYIGMSKQAFTQITVPTDYTGYFFRVGVKRPGLELILSENTLDGLNFGLFIGIDGHPTTDASWLDLAFGSPAPDVSGNVASQYSDCINTDTSDGYRRWWWKIGNPPLRQRWSGSNTFNFRIAEVNVLHSGGAGIVLGSTFSIRSGTVKVAPDIHPSRSNLSIPGGSIGITTDVLQKTALARSSLVSGFISIRSGTVKVAPDIHPSRSNLSIPGGSIGITTDVLEPKQVVRSGLSLSGISIAISPRKLLLVPKVATAGLPLSGKSIAVSTLRLGLTVHKTGGGISLHKTSISLLSTKFFAPSFDRAFRRKELGEYRIQWSDGFRETLRFRTEIITHRSGQEQRIAYRYKPERTYEFNSFLDDADFRSFMARNSTNQGKLTYIPHPRDTISSNIDIIPNGLNQTITFRGIFPGWVVAGRKIFLEIDRRLLRGDIVSVSGNNVTFKFPTPLDLGGRKIFRGIPVRPNTSYGINALTSRIGNMPVNMLADRVTDWYPTYPSTPPYTLNSVEYFKMKPNWGQGVSVNVPEIWENVDFNRNAYQRLFPQSFPTRVSKYRFALWDQDRITQFLGLFHRIRGRQRSFYMPSHVHEVKPNKDLLSGANTMDVFNSEIFDTYGENPGVFKYLLFLTRTNEVVMQVDEIVADGADSRIIFSSTFPFDILLNDLLMVSWVNRVRLESDSITLNWLTDGLAETELNVRVLEDVQ